MSAALARATTPVPTHRAGGGRTRLRVVGGPDRRAVGPVPPAASGAGTGRLLLVPLGEVLVPAGRTPVLRLLPPGPAPAGGAAHRGRSAAGRARTGVDDRSACGDGRRRRLAPPAAARPVAGPGRCGARSTVRPALVLRRVVAAAAVLAAGLLLGAARLVTGGDVLPAAAAAPAAEQRVVVVEAGQTLWSLAQELAPEADPRVLVEELRLVNRLDGAGLSVGQRLLVPAGG